MTVSTFPPHFFVACGCDCLRRERTVQFLTPLFTQFRLFCGKIIEPGQDFSPRTIRTIGSHLRPMCNGGSVFMTEFAYPPCRPIAVRRDACGGQSTVFCRMPLRCYSRISRSKVVFTGNDHFSRTDGTARSLTA